MEEILDVTLLVTDCLERLAVPHAVAGSLASSFHGVPRATLDADIVAALRLEHVSDLVDALRGRFYLDADAIRQAVQDRTSFNVIHLRTMFKVDVFVAGQDRDAREQLERGRRFTVTEDPRRELTIASPEDTIVQKLRWYRLGDEESERQWSDAQGVLKVTGGTLDLAYLQRAAAALGVGDLLRRAIEEAGLDEAAPDKPASGPDSSDPERGDIEQG